MRVNWIVIDFDVTEANQVVELDKKIPAHLKKCVGILSAICGQPLPSEEKILAGVMDNVTLNNKLASPYEYPLLYCKNMPLPIGGVELLPVDVDLTRNSRCAWKYTDYNTMLDGDVFIPYSVRLYLKCLKDE